MHFAYSVSCALHRAGIKLSFFVSIIGFFIRSWVEAKLRMEHGSTDVPNEQSRSVALKATLAIGAQNDTQST